MGLIQPSGRGTLPNGAATVYGASGVVANAVANAVVPQTGDTAWLCGFTVTGLGATAATSVTVTVTGLLGGVTLSYVLAVPAGVTTPITPLTVEFATPLQSAPGTTITVSVPAFGAGNTAVSVVAHGYHGLAS
jgi:hypothetical protein